MDICPAISDWERLGPVALVGHRGVGKSTLGRMAAERLDRPFFDLDDEIARQCGRSIADLVEDDPKEFRRRERRILGELCREDKAPIIACGAGVEQIPAEVFGVWIDRSGWRQEVRSSERPRVRPELSVAEEFRWMEQTRPPLWRRISHLRLRVPRGRTVATSADRLATLLRWSASFANSPVAEKTWIVPDEASQLERAIRDAHRFGAAGVEVRSDVFASTPAPLEPTPHLASLRHGESQWLANFPDAAAWDIDARFAGELPASLAEAAPHRIIISSHPDRPRQSDPEELDNAARTVAATLDLPDESIELKYAPQLADFDDVSLVVDLADRLQHDERSAAILPRPRRFAWMRPIFASCNSVDYLPVHLRSEESDHPTPIDFADVLPHRAGPLPRRFDALIGDPVDHSRGDVWHRARSLAHGESGFGYLKIPAGRGELDAVLEILEQLPIRGISVTSPLKVETAESPRVQNRHSLPALNTLRRRRDASHTWSGTDTDQAGVEATLRRLEQRGIGPGRCIVFGRGGASHAVLRALERRRWTLVAHVSARAGWTGDHAATGHIELVVNAAGPAGSNTDFAPDCRAWFDLHYTDVSLPPTDALHIQGDRMFEVQATAQRKFWSIT